MPEIAKMPALKKLNAGIRKKP
jgi:hypothetical protein